MHGWSLCSLGDPSLAKHRGMSTVIVCCGVSVGFRSLLFIIFLNEMTCSSPALLKNKACSTKICWATYQIFQNERIAFPI